MSLRSLSILERFPYELLSLIHERLDDVSAICLKYTNSTLKHKLNRDPKSFNRCTKWLIMCRFEQDELLTLSRPGDRVPGKHVPRNQFTCAYCKVKRTRAQIDGRRSVGRKGISFPTCSPGRTNHSSVARSCAQHPLFIIWVKPSSGIPDPASWMDMQRLTCMHCAALVTSADVRSAGCESCKCDVCPRHLKTGWIRYGELPKAARGGRPYIDGFVRSELEQCYYVSEVGKFSMVRSLHIPGPENYLRLARHFPEYDGNLTDASPWEWKEKKRAKFYTAVKSFAATLISPYWLLG